MPNRNTLPSPDAAERAPLDGQVPTDAATDAAWDIPLPVPVPDAFLLPDVPPGPCEPLGETQPCYPGPPGTVGVGACSSGTRTCGAEGWGPCQGATLPTAETCDASNQDCDGRADEGTATGCYDGPPGTDGVGRCVSGTRRCVAGVFGACDDQQLPRAEGCDQQDDDCDGVVDEGACECEPGGAPRDCYSGPPGTRGVGRCAPGNQQCSAQGEYGPCAGEVGPRGERCDGSDDDCDGATDEGLAGADCSAGQGVCRVEGRIDCVRGELVCDAAPPAGGVETCNAVDDDCDGTTDEDAAGDCALDHAEERCIEGTCWVESCEDGFIDADRLANNGCEVGCVMGERTFLLNAGFGQPAVAYSADGRTIGVASPFVGGGLQFAAVRAGAEPTTQRYIDPERQPHGGVDLVGLGVDTWGLASVVAGEVRYQRVGPGGIDAVVENLGTQTTHPTVVRSGDEIYLGYEGWRDGLRRLFVAHHPPGLLPDFLDRESDRDWVIGRRTLYRFGARQDFVGVARGGQELAVETFGDAPFAAHRPADIAGDPSWIHRGDTARVLWHTANNRLGWADVDFTDGSISAVTLVGANILGPVGFRSAGRDRFIYRTPANQVRLGVFPNGDNVQNRDLTNLLPFEWVELDVAVNGNDIAVALMDPDGSLWLVQGTCQ